MIKFYTNGGQAMPDARTRTLYVLDYLLDSTDEGRDILFTLRTL